MWKTLNSLNAFHVFWSQMWAHQSHSPTEMLWTNELKQHCNEEQANMFVNLTQRTGIWKTAQATEPWGGRTASACWFSPS